MHFIISNLSIFVLLITSTISLNNFLGSRDSSLIKLWQAYFFFCPAKSLTRNFLIPPIFWEMEINFAKLVLFSFFYIYTLEKRFTVWIWLYIVDWHLLRIVLNKHTWKKKTTTTTTKTSNNSTRKGTTSGRGKEQKICMFMHLLKHSTVLQDYYSQ